MKVKVLFTQSCPTLCGPMDCSPPVSSVLPMKFSTQEYLSELPFPSPGDLPDPGIKPMSPILQADSLPSESPGNPNIYIFNSCSVTYVFPGVRDPGSIPGWGRSPGEDPLENRMATHSNILAWRIPWTEEPGGLQSRGL